MRRTCMKIFAALLVAVLFTAGCENIASRTPCEPAGNGQAGNKGGAITVTARVSSGASRSAMPSIPALVYAALLYQDGNPPTNPQSDDFATGTVADTGKMQFSFQRPDDTSGNFTLEIFAFKAGTTDFSRGSALLSGKKEGLSVVGDKIEVSDAITLSSEKLGTVELKIKVPSGCTLEIDETNGDGARFAVSGTSPNFTIKHSGESGIPSGMYQVSFVVKKGGQVIYIFSEDINVLPGMTTDTWDGKATGEAKEITQDGISKTVYVRGAGGWYSTSPYKDTATASDTNSGSFLAPFETIQKAVDAIIKRNDGTSAYTICVDGTVTGTAAANLGENGMADFSALAKNLNLTIKALSGTATLDAGARFDGDGNATAEGIGKRVIYAKPASGKLKLTLENLTIMGGNAEDNGGGIYFGSSGGTLTIGDGTISGNKANGTSSENGGGGVYVNAGTFTMTGGTISGNTATNFGGGLFVYNGKFTMEGSATISGNKATKSGGGVCVYGSSTFIMNGGEISGNIATNYGGGVYSKGTFTMSGGTIGGSTDADKNTARLGGGVYVSNGTFTMSGGTISGNTATSDGGGIYIDLNRTFTMSGGTISGNTASEYGGGVYTWGSFAMSGSAKVAADNDVYLYTNKTIQVAGALTADSPVATITPSAYELNKEILSGDAGVITKDICKKFALASVPAGEEWSIAPDDTGEKGLLKTTKVYVSEASNSPSDDNSGSIDHPFATIQKAVDEVIAMNDGTSAYTIYVDGTLDGTTAANLGANGMADFSALAQDLTLTIKALSGTATLDAGARFDSDDTTINEGIRKRVMYAKPASTNLKLNLTLENLTITGGNIDDDYGGGVYFSSNGGTLTISDGTTIIGNRTRYKYGGGVYVGSGSKFTMTGGTISGNKGGSRTSGHGGGVYVNSGTFEMSGTAKISENTAGGGNFSGDGGGVCVEGSGSKFTMTGGEISGNIVTGNVSGGGGIYFNSSGGTLTISGGTISGNTSYTGGGVQVAYNGTFMMDGGTISENEATGTGGGVYICSNNVLAVMNGGTIEKNTAQNGGGVGTGSASFTMDGGEISRNTATYQGGGVYFYNGTFTINDGTISGNTATSKGGGVYNYGGTFENNGGAISGNTPNEIAP